MKYFIKKLSKLLFLFVGTVLYVSCYRPNNIPQPDTIPTYSISARWEGNYYYGDAGSIQDSIVTFMVNSNDSFTLYLNFNLISGNPVNFPITCYLGNLPFGITTSDSETFKLNYFAQFTVYSTTDTGIYPFNINVRTPVSGLQSYLVRMHVLSK